MFNIVPATSQDFARIKELGNEFHRTPDMVDPQFVNLSTVSTPILIDKQIAVPDSSVTTLVARLNNHVIGFISFIKEEAMNEYLSQKDPESKNCASILFLAVDAKYRRQSVGSSLLKSCLKYLHIDGISIVRVNTDYGNIGALELYQKMGFRVILNWHIYRIYKHELHPSLSYQTVRSMLPAPSWAEPLGTVILRRPIAWYYTPQLNTTNVHQFILDRFHNKLKSNAQAIIQKVLHNKILGITLRHDKDKELYFGLKGTIWHISDLLENGIRGELLPQFTQYILSQLPNFLMAELWINASDYETQRIANQIGMKMVYGGISLIHELSDTDE